MKPLILLALSLVCLSSTAIGTEIKGTPEELRAFLHPQKKSVSLIANAERRVYANQAIVSILVKNEAKTLGKAMSENKALRDELRKKLTAAGIAGANIKNSKFSSSPQYGWFGDKPSSFEVSNRVSVIVESEQALQAIANASDQNDEVSIAGTEFRDTNKETIKRELKKEAMDKVLKDKSYYETSLNVTLVAVSFYDSGLQIGATQGEMNVEMLRVTGVRKSNSDSSVSFYREEEKQASSFEEIQYSTTMRIEYEISEGAN